MLIYQSSLEGSGRPCAGRECPECGGAQNLHKHGRYWRHCGLEGSGRVQVQRYLCPRCGHTWSVIPDGMMPYRSLEVARFEELADERFGLAGRGARPPPATEKEEGGIRRACKVLSKRIPFLCGLLGQQMPVLEGEDICGFWRAVRKLGSTGETLVRLARDFKTSLLGCYKSLLAHWERDAASVRAQWRGAGPPHKTVY